MDSAPAQAQQQELPAATPLERVMTSISIPQRVPKEKSEPAPQKPYLVRVIAGSVEEDEFPLNLNGTTTIGRKFCDVVFPDDIYLSERHASIVHGPDGFSLRDDGSSTGVFVKAVEGKSIEVSTSDLLRLGRQFLVFNNDNGSFGFTQYDQTGKEVKRYNLSDKTIVLGREAPDITLDPKDMTLSRRHLSISVKDGKMFIKDLKSVNGTYLKVRSAVTLEDGDQFRVGQQAFKLSYQKQQAPTKVHVTTRVSIPPKFSQTPLPVAQPAPAVAATGMSVVIRNVGKSFSFAAGQTLCEVAEKGGVKIVAECHAGICGSDPVKIISGKENLNPMGAEEKGTLEDICGVSPEECRLACMAFGVFPDREEDVISAKGQLFVVADGMGGHQGGREASSLAVQRIMESYDRGNATDVPQSLVAAMQAANEEIHNASLASTALSGMGTTCVVLLVKDRRVYVAHVGDSRVYSVTKRGIKQVTEDHSTVAEMTRRGILTPEEAKYHPERSVLYRALGTASSTEIDAQPEIVVTSNEWFVLCTDGLSNMVEDDEIQKIVTSREPQEACDELVRLANERGGYDNITIAVVRVKVEDSFIDRMMS
ncbi:MAG: hypothetical protein HW412_2597 [Bacteroidetes bacterium]|nr:hypothetical protein [Bacteroidota bacterium]